MKRERERKRIYGWMRLKPLILFVWNRCANEGKKERRKGERTLGRRIVITIIQKGKGWSQRDARRKGTSEAIMEKKGGREGGRKK